MLNPYKSQGDLHIANVKKSSTFGRPYNVGHSDGFLNTAVSTPLNIKNKSSTTPNNGMYNTEMEQRNHALTILRRSMERNQSSDNIQVERNRNSGGGIKQASNFAKTEPRNGISMPPRKRQRAMNE